MLKLHVFFLINCFCSQFSFLEKLLIDANECAAGLWLSRINPLESIAIIVIVALMIYFAFRIRFVYWYIHKMWQLIWSRKRIEYRIHFHPSISCFAWSSTSHAQSAAGYLLITISIEIINMQTPSSVWEIIFTFFFDEGKC